MEISNKLKLGGCYSGHFVGGLNRSNPDKFATEIKKHLSTERDGVNIVKQIFAEINKSKRNLRSPLNGTNLFGQHAFG